MPIFSPNGAGCISKIQSIVDNINNIKAGIVTLQETHFKKKGKLNSKLPDFEFFEAIRKKVKGGTLIGVHKSLDPILIEEYSEEFELIVVKVKLGNKDVRVMSGYGPQENWRVEDRMPFFRALEKEIVKAQMMDKLVLIQMDANSKLGHTIIAGDPHSQSSNGKILANIVERNALFVVNSLQDKCSGLITRERITNKVRERSIIDLLIVCQDMLHLVEKLLIDEEKKYVLTKYKKTKQGVKIQESDHNSLITTLKTTWQNKIKSKPKEVYNFKDPDGLKKFKEMTSQGTFLSEVFENKNKNIEVTSKQFLKRFGFCLSKCFRKVRIGKTKKNIELDNLFTKRRILRNKTKQNSYEELKCVEEKLADVCKR